MATRYLAKIVSGDTGGILWGDGTDSDDALTWWSAGQPGPTEPDHYWPLLQGSLPLSFVDSQWSTTVSGYYPWTDSLDARVQYTAATLPNGSAAPQGVASPSRGGFRWYEITRATLDEYIDPALRQTGVLEQMYLAIKSAARETWTNSYAILIGTVDDATYGVRPFRTWRIPNGRLARQLSVEAVTVNAVWNIETNGGVSLFASNVYSYLDTNLP